VHQRIVVEGLGESASRGITLVLSNEIHVPQPTVNEY
jgi:hypothetical protein